MTSAERSGAARGDGRHCCVAICANARRSASCERRRRGGRRIGGLAGRRVGASASAPRRRRAANQRRAMIRLCLEFRKAFGSRLRTLAHEATLVSHRPLPWTRAQASVEHRSRQERRWPAILGLAGRPSDASPLPALGRLAWVKLTHRDLVSLSHDSHGDCECVCPVSLSRLGRRFCRGGKTVPAAAHQGASPRTEAPRRRVEIANTGGAKLPSEGSPYGG